MNISSFTMEKRAMLQAQAYGKVYAFCDICNLPLIPTSKCYTGANINEEALYNLFIPCCPNGMIKFGVKKEEV